MPAPLSARRVVPLAGPTACLLLVAFISLPARAEPSSPVAAADPATDATPSPEDSAPVHPDPAAASDEAAAPGSEHTTPAPDAPVAGPTPQDAGSPADPTSENDASPLEAPPTSNEPPSAAEEPAPIAEAPSPANEDPSLPAEETIADRPLTTAPERSATETSSDAPRPPPAVTRPVPPPAPPAKKVMHDLALETGWNNPTGTGLRYLFVLPGTQWSIGAGLGGTLWGGKVSLAVRRADDVSHGGFFQAGLGLLGERKGEKREIVSQGRTVTATFDYTTGRTIDLTYGYRWPLAFGYVEAAAHWSINLVGTVLQAPTNGVLFPIDEASREGLLFGAPGGLGAGVAYGLQF